MPYTDDPIADFDRHDARQSAWLKRRPQCSECDHHIQDEKCYQFNGELICHSCLETYHEKWTEDFVE